jgi:hypothetical protein
MLMSNLSLHTRKKNGITILPPKVYGGARDWTYHTPKEFSRKCTQPLFAIDRLGSLCA